MKFKQLELVKFRYWLTNVQSAKELNEVQKNKIFCDSFFKKQDIENEKYKYVITIFKKTDDFCYGQFGKKTVLNIHKPKADKTIIEDIAIDNTPYVYFFANMKTDIQSIYFSKDSNIYRNIDQLQSILNSIFANVLNGIIATAHYSPTHHQFRNAIFEFEMLKRIKLTYHPDNSRRSGQTAYNLSNQLKTSINANQNTIIAENNITGLNKENVVDEFEDDTNEFDSLAGDWEVKGITPNGATKTINKNSLVSSTTIKFRNPDDDDAVFDDLKKMAKKNE